LTFRRLGAAVLAAWVTVAAIPGHAEPLRPEVQLSAGRLRGVLLNGVASFKGIPYAAPPVGERRWRPPAKAPAWSGAIDAASFGPACPQMSRVARWGTARTSEDCLTVNVWKPQAKPAHPLAVMVWIHGGGFLGGASGKSWYDGTRLARHDVVVVSFNYRVGRLGFFAHPALTKTTPPGEPLGNYAFMDQLAALDWVKVNIAAFDGDPANVTIFGQSAGGSSVDLLMLAPQARGLFAKAISQSGFPRWGGKPMRGAPNSAEDIGAEFAAAKHIAGDPAAVAAQLRALPVKEVMESEPPADIDRTTPEPIIDGSFLTGNAAALLGEGRLAAVPLLLGGTSCDASVYGGDYLSAFDFAEPKGQPFESLYPGTPQDALMEALTDRVESEPARYQARMHKATGQPVWVYRFEYRHLPRHAGDCVGAPHAADIPFVFGTLSAHSPFPEMSGPRRAISSADRRLSNLLMTYWSSFAKFGDPNASGTPHWAPFDDPGEPVMVFGITGPTLQLNYRQAQLDWIESKLTKPAVW
jgi:para-nitrobenzyl esterase